MVGTLYFCPHSQPDPLLAQVYTIETGQQGGADLLKVVFQDQKVNSTFPLFKKKWLIKKKQMPFISLVNSVKT